MNCAKSSVTLDRLIEDLVAFRAEHGMGEMPVGFFSAKDRKILSGVDGSNLIEHKFLIAAKLEAALGEPFLAFVLAGAEKDLGVRTQLAANLS